MVKILCAVQRRRFPVGVSPTRRRVAPAGSHWSGGGGNEAVEASEERDRLGRFREHAGRNASERRAGLERPKCGSRPVSISGKAAVAWGRSDRSTHRFRRGSGVGMRVQGRRPQHGKPLAVAARDRQPDSREGQAGPRGVAERFVVARKPGNAGGAKEPWFKDNGRSGGQPGDWP